MNKSNLAAILFAFVTHLSVSAALAETTLSANGSVDPYLLVHEAFNTEPQVPDCVHSIQHITPYYDSTFNDYVFNFHSHRDHDNDRCLNFDRQRTEIFVGLQSPSNMTAVENEIHTYRWKFRLNSGFQPSSSFTHIFQIKTNGQGAESSPAVFNFTLRKGSPDTLRMRYRQQELKSVSLQGFKGTWVEAYVRTKYSNNGWIEVELRRIPDGATLLTWSKSGIDMWQYDSGIGTIMKPKWGVYRSLNNSQDLRDEHTHFNDFCIAEGTDTCPSYFDPQPSAPANISGPSQVNGGNYSISWSSSTGASRYELWESFFGTAFTKVYDGSNTFKGFSSKPAGEYTYKVKACNPTGCSAFSATHFCMVCNPQCL